MSNHDDVLDLSYEEPTIHPRVTRKRLEQDAGYGLIMQKIQYGIRSILHGLPEALMDDLTMKGWVRLLDGAPTWARALSGRRSDIEEAAEWIREHNADLEKTKDDPATHQLLGRAYNCGRKEAGEYLEECRASEKRRKEVNTEDMLNIAIPDSDDGWYKHNGVLKTAPLGDNRFEELAQHLPKIRRLLGAGSWLFQDEPGSPYAWLMKYLRNPGVATEEDKKTAEQLITRVNRYLRAQGIRYTGHKARLRKKRTIQTEPKAVTDLGRFLCPECGDLQLVVSLTEDTAELACGHKRKV